jgi:hypothetical protein
MNIKTQDNMIDFAREALGLSGSVFVELKPLPVRGSDRVFFRLKWNGTDSAILIRYDPKRLENTYYADIAVFLREIHVSVPRLISHDPARCLMLIEDIGDTDLWSIRHSDWEMRRTLYQKTLAAAHRLHSFPEKNFPSDRIKLMEGFDPVLYKWEREYFKENFVTGVCSISIEVPLEQKLEKELSALAERLAETKRSLVHRDLQSQNVLIRYGEPFLIDFQGMRFGNPFYDLGSLLCDPYVNFSGFEIEELLSFYYVIASWDMEWDTFVECFWEASAQRLMQALGAYGFLGLRKGLGEFLGHIPAALSNLQRAAASVESLPHLLELAGTCQGAIAR